jgi:hypothetical protein
MAFLLLPVLITIFIICCVLSFFRSRDYLKNKKNILYCSASFLWTWVVTSLCSLALLVFAIYAHIGISICFLAASILLGSLWLLVLSTQVVVFDEDYFVNKTVLTTKIYAYSEVTGITPDDDSFVWLGKKRIYLHVALGDPGRLFEAIKKWARNHGGVEERCPEKATRLFNGNMKSPGGVVFFWILFFWAMFVFLFVMFDESSFGPESFYPDDLQRYEVTYSSHEIDQFKSSTTPIVLIYTQEYDTAFLVYDYEEAMPSYNLFNENMQRGNKIVIYARPPLEENDMYREVYYLENNELQYMSKYDRINYVGSFFFDTAKGLGIIAAIWFILGHAYAFFVKRADKFPKIASVLAGQMLIKNPKDRIKRGLPPLR